MGLACAQFIARPTFPPLPVRVTVKQLLKHIVSIVKQNPLVKGLHTP